VRHRACISRSTARAVRRRVSRVCAPNVVVILDVDIGIIGIVFDACRPTRARDGR
tara:strand:- start:431 stop:595 length:165 start_codon:yes stop_codon:yes gene_type:complete